MDLFKNIEFSLGSAVPSENICTRNILDIISPSLDTRLRKTRSANNKLITGWIKNWRTQVTTEERLQNRINITSLVTDASISPKRSSFIRELTQLLQVANENDYSAFINLVTHHASNERISLTLNEIEDTLKGIISLRDSKREKIDADTLNAYISQTTQAEKRLLQKLFELGILRYDFSKISSGESALLNIFLAIGNALVNVVPDDSSPVLLLIDEGETFLHPSWQKKYLSQLLDYVGKNEKIANRVHLIITTHSLIIAGDCPPGTLYDMGKQKNVNGFGLGPKSILEDVYNAGDFSGELSIKLFEKIISNVKIKDKKTFKSALLLIESLADEKLKNVLKEKIKKAGEFHD
nr:AAA family ATPase [Enterobacter sp. Tr-810]